MTISLQEIKDYLREDGTDDDLLIQTLIDAAIDHCETILCRPILDARMTVDTTWSVPQSIRLVIYLLCAHWYENRMPVGQYTNEVGLTVSALLKPHKFFNV